MYFSHLMLPTPEENLALEEAWLDMAEDGEWSAEILRLWQPNSTFVVIGRGSRLTEEVNLAATKAAGVPVLRRASGGAAVVAGPGCLMYSVLLSYELRPHLRSLDLAHQEVMQTLLSALKPLKSELDWRGTCDLVVPDNDRSAISMREETGASALRLREEETGASAQRLREEGTGASALRLREEGTGASALRLGEKKFRKVSGNSLRCRRQWMLYHGTLLLSMDLDAIDRFLLHPPREPEYRQKRRHTDFVANLDLASESVIDPLVRAWQADPHLAPPVPTARIKQLVADRYANDDWLRQR